MNLVRYYYERKNFRLGNKKFGSYYEKYKDKAMDLFQYFQEQEEKMIVWGAGQKGKALLYHYDSNQHFIEYVIDIDPKKQGNKLLTGHKVTTLKILDTESPVIFVVNEKFYPSVCYSLLNSGYDVKKLKIICLDHYFNGCITIEDIKNQTVWERKRYYD